MFIITNPPMDFPLEGLGAKLGEILEVRTVNLWDQDFIMINPATTHERFESILDDLVSDWPGSELLIIEGDSPLSGLRLQGAGGVKLDAATCLDGSTSVFIAGPCAVESREQIEEVAGAVSAAGLRFLRGGAFKPRTSGYSFQGRGIDGLKDMREAANQFNLSMVTEVRSETEVEAVATLSDVIQVGAKSTYNFTLLREVGRTGKPILLKRGFMMTVQEFLQASDVVLAEGNENVILCERGIRTFETATRFTLDITSAAKLKHLTHLPIIIDPSHAAGSREIVGDLARAALALDIDGLIAEVHPSPQTALSDAAQAFPLQELPDLVASLQRVCAAVGRQLI